MKCLGVLVALCAFAAVQASPQNFPIIKPSKRTVVAPPVVDSVNFDPSFSCDSQNRITCGSCSSVMICNYEGNTVGGYDCSSIDSSKPFCIGNGICSGKPAVGCNIKSDLCPTADYFYPVPSNCSELVYCDDKQTATKIPSPSPTAIFNYDIQSWTLRVAPTDCFQVNCEAAGQLNKWYAYKPSPKLSIYCSSQGPLTFVCEKDNEVFNEATKSCELACTKEGNFAYPGDSSLYYLCLSDGKGGFQKLVNSCLPGFTFVSGTNLNKCIKSTPAQPEN